MTLILNYGDFLSNAQVTGIMRFRFKSNKSLGTGPSLGAP